MRKKDRMIEGGGSYRVINLALAACLILKAGSKL